MKLLIFLAFISVFSLSSCAFGGKESSPRSLFRIEGKLGEKNRVGVGACIGEKTLLTSAHVVADDRYKYTSSEFGTLPILSRSIPYDTATLEISSGSCIPEKISQRKPLVGEKIFASVFRGDTIVTLTGKIIELEKQGIGYSENGKVHGFTTKTVTDIVFLPGDSGAPIFNYAYELIDIVHTKK